MLLVKVGNLGIFCKVLFARVMKIKKNFHTEMKSMCCPYMLLPLIHNNSQPQTDNETANSISQ